MLDVLGLDATADMVYRAMLTDPAGGVDELCQQLDLPEGAVREALDRLADLELLQLSRDNPGLMRPVSLQLGLQILIRHKELALRRHQYELAISKVAIARAIAEHSASTAQSIACCVEYLAGSDAIHERLEIARREVKQVCVAVVDDGFPTVAAQMIDFVQVIASSNAAKASVLVPRDIPFDAIANASRAPILSDSVTIRRSTAALPAMAILDRSTAIVAAPSVAEHVGALFTRDQRLVAFLVNMFDRTWRQASASNGEISADSVGAPMYANLLKLLATGLPDEVVSKRLGVSVRTIRRQMSSLMESLGASSRFEAGVKAAQRGWI